MFVSYIDHHGHLLMPPFEPIPPFMYFMPSLLLYSLFSASLFSCALSQFYLCIPLVLGMDVYCRCGLGSRAGAGLEDWPVRARIIHSAHGGQCVIRLFGTFWPPSP